MRATRRDSRNQEVKKESQSNIAKEKVAKGTVEKRIMENTMKKPSRRRRHDAMMKADPDPMQTHGTQKYKYTGPKNAKTRNPKMKMHEMIKADPHQAAGRRGVQQCRARACRTT